MKMPNREHFHILCIDHTQRPY